MYPFISLVKKEFIHFFRDPVVAGLIFYHFTVCIFICGYSFVLESHHLKVAVYDMSRSTLSREFSDRFFASEHFDVDRYVENMDELRTRIDSGGAEAALILPASFSRDIEDGRGGNVQYISDGANANMAGQGIGYATAIIEDINQDLTLANLKRQGQNYEALPGISNNVRNLYNQGMREVFFVVISHILVAGVIGGLILSSTAIVREKELGTIDQLLVTPISTFELLLAKSVAPLIICCIATIFSFLIVVWFEVPLKGSLFVFGVFTILFLCSMIGIGVLLGSICNNMLQTILLSFLIWFPSTFLSGVATPVANMLPAIQKIAGFLPATHYMNAANAIFQKGAGFAELWVQALALLISAVLLFSIGTGITWRQWRQ